MTPYSSRTLSNWKTNKDPAAKGLILFLRSYAPGLAPKSLHLRKLPRKEYEPGVASPVNGLLLFSDGNDEFERVDYVEVENMIAKDTVCEAKERGRLGKYVQIFFSISSNAV